MIILARKSDLVSSPSSILEIHFKSEIELNSPIWLSPETDM